MLLFAHKCLNKAFFASRLSFVRQKFELLRVHDINNIYCQYTIDLAAKCLLKTEHTKIISFYVSVQASTQK